MKVFWGENIGFSACVLTYFYVKRQPTSFRYTYTWRHLTQICVKHPLISHCQPQTTPHLTKIYVKHHHLSPNPQPAYFEDNTYEPNQSHYHPDHLGSTSFITNTFGYVQRNNYSSRYTVSAKEKDNETGYSYFGARYYDSELSVWLSVDAMADKYPALSPYMYVARNPLVIVDSDGRKVILTGTEEENQAYVDELNSSLSTIQVELYGRKNNQLRIIGGNDQELEKGVASALDMNVQKAIKTGKHKLKPYIDNPDIDFVDENSSKIDVGDFSILSENEKPLKEALFARMYIDANFGKGQGAVPEGKYIEHGYIVNENFYEYGRIEDLGWRTPRNEVGLSSKSNGVGLFIFGRIEIEISFDQNGIVIGSRAYQVGYLLEREKTKIRIPVKSK